MRNRTVNAFFLGTALLLASALPARAQTLGAGVSFLGDEGGIGATVDYSKPVRTLSKDRTLGWVADASFHHNGDSIEGFSASVNQIMVQGGVRLGGTANEKVSWHVQGLAGLAHASVGGDAGDALDELGDLCNEVGVDCGDAGSNNTFVITPGAGIDYALKPGQALRAQFDLPIAVTNGGGSTWRFWVGLSWLLKNR